MTIQQLAKDAAEKIRPKGFAGHSHSLYDEGYRQGFAEGIELMYKAMGWRDADAPVLHSDYHIILTISGHIFRDYLIEGSNVKKDYPYATHYALARPPLPHDLTQLQKAFEEQLQHKP